MLLEWTIHFILGVSSAGTDELRYTIVELAAKKERVMSDISVISNDNSGGGYLGGSTDILSTHAGRQFGGRYENIYGKKK